MRAPEVRALAAAAARDLDGFASDMYAHIAAHVPESHTDEEIAALTLASCASNIQALLSMIRHGIALSATEAPVAALEHARQMAARGIGVDATLRFYRYGQAYFFERMSHEFVGAIGDRDELAAALRETAGFIAGYVDRVSSRVSAELLAERDRRLRRTAVLRAEVVRALLAGERVDLAAAERTLAHALTPPQLALLCWTDGDGRALERAAAVAADAAGGGRPLLLAEGPRTLAVWVVAGAGEPAGLRGALAEAAPEVHVALGAVAAGPAGFRRSREQADRARRIAELSGARAPSLTRYGDVALVDLLTGDLSAARAFVRAELGALAADDPATRRLREALLAVVAPRGGLASAARSLGLHRNTVLQRVRRAEQMLGHDAQERPSELHAALLLAAALGEAILAEG
ncbi:MAG TPA: helix-turn-helix domain-containing protein [Solirubrobacteraceae bacterium]|nr:helix-turn-helix domain-containing protein [Solirubrobacteraceae bacterium]